MTWWKLNEDKYTGDQAADVVGIHLDHLLQKHETSWTFYQFLNEFLFALRLHIGTINESDDLKIIAGFKSHDLIISLKYAKDYSFDYAEEWSVLIKDLINTYQKEWNRNPSLQEILATFSYVVTALPDGYFLDLKKGSLIFLALK